MPRPSTSHLTDQQRHARAGRAQVSPARAGAGDKGRHSSSTFQAALDGPGDYFNLTGQRIKHVPGRGGLIRIVSGKDVRLLSQVNVHEGKNLKLVANIAAYYAKGRLHLPGVYGASSTQGEGAMAYTPDENHTYLAANKVGFLSKNLNDYNNLQSVLRHEHFHQKDKGKRVPNNFGTHFNVYIRQFNDSNFAATTLLFKLGTIAHAVEYLYNDYMQGQPHYQQAGFSESIDTLNQTIERYQIRVDAASQSRSFSIEFISLVKTNGRSQTERNSVTYPVIRKTDAS